MFNFGKMARLMRWDWGDRLAVTEGFALLLFASAAIRLLPFRHVVALAARAGRGGKDKNSQQREISRCRWAIRAWSRIVPWRTVCFQQGLALHLMLRRRGVASVLHYGVSSSTDGVSAHVWVSVGGTAILGGEDARQHALLASFPAGVEGIPEAHGG